MMSLRAPCDEAAIGASPACSDPQPAAVGFWVLTATILGSSIVFIDGTAVNVALPALQRGLGASAADVQWVVEAYALFLASLILTGGALGDRFGRKRIYLLGVLIFTVASLLCGVSPTIGLLIFGRALQGIGGALLVPGGLAIIGATFTDAERGRAIGTWSGFTTLTSALGPVLGGWLVQTISWRAVFFINVPLAALMLSIASRHVPESRDMEATGKVDWPGALLATLGLGGVVYGLIEWGALGPDRAQVLAPLVLGFLALCLFVIAEAHRDQPMLPLSLFRSRTFSGANLLTLLLYGALGATLYYLPFTLQQVQGYSAAEAGASLLPFTALMVGLSRWSGGLVDQFGARLPLTLGPAIAALGFALFALPGVGGSYWSTYFPAVVVLGLGMSVTVAPLTTAVMGAVAQNRSGIASGVNNAVSRASGLLALAILGIVVTAVFTHQLDMSLDTARVSPAVRQALDSQHSRLAAIVLPSRLPHDERAAMQQAVDAAFLDGFRAVMLIGAGLSALSAVVAALLIQDSVQAAGTDVTSGSSTA